MTPPMTPADTLLALAGRKPLSDYDAKVIRAVGDGALTWRVAARIDVPTSHIRQRLKRLEREGYVHRDPRSSVNNIIWVTGSARAALASEAVSAAIATNGNTPDASAARVASVADSGSGLKRSAPATDARRGGA